MEREIKVAAIVPAYNEERTIANVLKALLAAKKNKIIDEIIVVSSGSTDKTAEISKSFGVKVIDSKKRKGKAAAMREGVEATKAKIIVFVDGDLIGLTPEHISELVWPVLENKADMVVGIRDRIGETPIFLLKIDPLLAFGGERALKRSIFENLPEKFSQGFGIETALNYYCKVNKLLVKYVKLKGLKMVVKERKMGLVKGFWERIKMMSQMIQTRIQILFHKHEFKNPPKF
jgi:glycosyltransferase involved in cell wall biosynthesis